ncbi:Uncharacterised protein [Mycobacteroides abscessus subsp. abscessus]|nr:Uncharacterised protein [Mycobacteroides abscessus subsp. abscessus]
MSWRAAVGRLPNTPIKYRQLAIPNTAAIGTSWLNVYSSRCPSNPFGSNASASSPEPVHPTPTPGQNSETTVNSIVPTVNTVTIQPPIRPPKTWNGRRVCGYLCRRRMNDENVRM